MMYLGGKYRISSKLVEFFQTQQKNNPRSIYYEPFLGAGWVAEKVSGFDHYAGSDANHDLMVLWSALQKGWIPPDSISEDEYRTLKSQTLPSPLRTFAGFGSSFSGKWFGGYARGAVGRNYASEAKRSLLKTITHLNKYSLFTHDFCANDAMPKKLKDELDKGNCFIYCDPPYDGTTGYKNVIFDRKIFLDQCVELKHLGNQVFVSEYNIIDERFEVCLEIASKQGMSSKDNKKKPTVERLYQIIL